MTKVHIIWDNSNILWSGRDYCKRREWREAQFRIYFPNLIDLAADGRPVEQVFCVGSVPPRSDPVWGHIEAITGRKPETYERGAQSGKEQAVDQALQTRMLRLGYDYPPETLVLLTGDGKGADEGVGFFADAQRLHKIGWSVEVVAWRDNCARQMREWTEENGVFVDLGDFYTEVTFLEGGDRNASVLDLTKRPRAK
ncbi:NYN domain-containing protein [Rhodovulum adriaticum]|uniref:NYN domain-containing protein n=1 Tax=Rhodovulum adriaticum TaxID=35804 RepID=UPI0010437280|nr:NYN domain-containing protein [Rhodovulum adriaticum]MBK1634881.1 hypothetical protein [Rhodovulum adriaticum]